VRFCIAIPVCGQANFLPTALESIRVQTQNVQLAVMDATADDTVQKVVESYRDLVSYRRHGPDSGQASAIQEGWDHTNGEIVAWLCADDYLFPDTLEFVEQVFRGCPDVDVVYGDSVFVDGDGRFIGYFPEIQSDISCIEEGCCISQPSCFVRRTALDRVGPLNPDLHYIMDWDLWTRLYRSGAKFHYLQKPLSIVRIYQGTKSSSRSWRRFSEIGSHLWQNTSAMKTAKSLLGFYIYDLLTCRVTGLERILLRGIDLYRSFKRRMGRPDRSREDTHHGLSSYGNEVRGEVDVFLPWYNPLPVTEVIVRCDLESAPYCDLNGVQLPAKPGSHFVFEVGGADFASHELKLRLSSKTEGAWHLYAVECRPGLPDTAVAQLAS
jgi:glycosyltransferase involved in cell wall biosynthesis